MHILGYSNAKEAPSPSLIHARVRPSCRVPLVQHGNVADSNVQIIMFRRPDPTRMQYMSLDPIFLALADKAEKEQTGEVEDAEEEREHQRRQRLVEKIRLHSVVKRPPSMKESSLQIIINQVNSSFEMGRLLRKNVAHIGPRAKRGLSVGERVVESASTLLDYVVLGLWGLVVDWLYPFFRRIFVVGLTCHRVVAEMILRVLEWRLHPGYAALKDVSATAQQIDIRLQQFCYWPIQYLTLRKRKEDWESMTDSHPDYIRFYNSLWLVANDVIMGIALGSYIVYYYDWVSYEINTVLSSYTVEGLQRMIAWLMDWPAGLKLNNELAAFLGDLFLWVIDYWAGRSLSLRAIFPD